MSDEIAGPKAGGAFIKVRDHLNHLVIFTKVKKVEERYDQKRKEQGEVLTVDFHCFNCEGLTDPEEKLLGHPHVSSKVQRDGRLTLGYIVQLQPKPGFDDGAFVLGDPRDEDYPNVQQWWDSVKARQIAAPVQQQPQAAPAPSPWDSGPPTQAAPAAPWGAPAASAPASSPGAGWQTTAPPAAAPVAAAAPPSAQTNLAAPPTPDQVRVMPVDGVRALIANGTLTIDQVRTVRQDV